MKPPVAERLKKLREAMGYESQTAWAKLLGISLARWNNVENGKSLGNDLAFKLVRTVPGLTLDWLYLGVSAGLPIELARRLGELPPAPGKRTNRKQKIHHN
jgi:DNA-binding XRE family transcriptional regulator